MKTEIEHYVAVIKEAAREIQKSHDRLDVLVNMRYEKPVGSSVIHVVNLSKICLQVYRGIPWKQAIDDVLDETFKSIGKGTINAYRNDYRLFFKKMINTINQEELHE
jgi:hypothetical protein